MPDQTENFDNKQLGRESQMKTGDESRYETRYETENENENENENRPDDWNYPKRNLIKLIAGYYGFIVFGMADSSIGVLLPSLEQHYKIDYLVVSIAFLTPFTGYGVAALLSDKLHRMFGRWGVCTMGTICQLICYIIACTAPPYPVFVIAYGIGGFGNGCLESALNSWMGGLDHANQILGLLHGFYGLGGIICPASFTGIIGSGVKWNYCYFLMIGMSVISVVFSSIAFWGDTGAHYREKIDNSDKELASIETMTTDSILQTDKAQNQSGNNNEQDASKNKSTSMMKEVLTNQLVWLLSAVLFLYVGAEVAFGGWISTFMIKVRHGIEKKMGYVTTGFWAGLTIGRMIIGFLIGHYGAEDYFVLGFLSASIGFLLIIWLVPVLVLSAVFAGLFGVAIGPLFPTIVVAAMKKLPVRLHVSGVGFCVAIGGAGAAIPPFINGVVANKFGPRVLGPFEVVLLGLMLATWIVVIRFHPSK
ncbi:Bsc6p [Sugiyamaella lignohabitans]|uniref:Bsc6p n=1 Tax=Sugiyamaella lignohabitans TaxID=796027 RepID=A0A167CVC7_9ASCO|nr:Bsc6p [Sugiyamaella lignohabitans]ANB12149.1 Bsc6p [Sugiyamaella lignohabitans]